MPVPPAPRRIAASEGVSASRCCCSGEEEEEVAEKEEEEVLAATVLLLPTSPSLASMIDSPEGPWEVDDGLAAAPEVASSSAAVVVEIATADAAMEAEAVGAARVGGGGAAAAPRNPAISAEGSIFKLISQNRFYDHYFEVLKE
jgi:hypothetical protein